MLKLEGIDDKAGACSDEDLDNSFNDMCSGESDDEEDGYDEEEDQDTVEKQIDMDESDEDEDDSPESSPIYRKKRVGLKKKSILLK